MNLHGREWLACICKSKSGDALSLAEVAKILRISKKQSFYTADSGSVTGARWSSATKYFRREAFTDGELSAYFDDDQRPMASGRPGNMMFSYPFYIASVVNHRYVVVLCPYAGLLSEVAIALEGGRNKLEFVRPRIDVIYGLTTQAPPSAIDDPLPKGYWRVLLRGARLRLRSTIAAATRSKLVRNIGLAGDDLRHSELFRALVEPEAPTNSFFELDDTVIKIQFISAEFDAITIKLDKFGNYTFRPGTNGLKLEVFDHFASRIAGKKGFVPTDIFPWRREASDVF